MGDFDAFLDFKTDVPTQGDPDDKSPRLRGYHQLLWTKELPTKGRFVLDIPPVRRNGYLTRTDPSGTTHWYGSDAITSSYTTWTKPPALVVAIAALDEDERDRYLNPPYTIGSAMIWPVRSSDRPTMNQARGFRTKIADRMDLTLECIRLHYAKKPGSPLSSVTDSYADFFALFDNFKGFADFFHFQDLVTEDYSDVQFFLKGSKTFERPGTPVSKDEYVEYREATLTFIEKRGRRMAEWIKENCSGDCGAGALSQVQ